jgi:hypothetical protein
MKESDMFGTYQRLGLPASASGAAVVRAAREKIAEHHRRSPAMRAERKKFYSIMLDYHRKAQGIVSAYRL